MRGLEQENSWCNNENETHKKANSLKINPTTRKLMILSILWRKIRMYLYLGTSFQKNTILMQKHIPE